MDGKRAYLLAPLGRDDALLREALAHVRAGGVLALQEPDASPWRCYPPRPGWDGLKAARIAAFAAAGGDEPGVGPRVRSPTRQ